MTTPPTTFHTEADDALFPLNSTRVSFRCQSPPLSPQLIWKRT